VKKIAIIFIILVSAVAQGHNPKITGKYCYLDESNAQLALNEIYRKYQILIQKNNNIIFDTRMRERLILLKPNIELVKDSPDNLGRTFCLTAYGKKVSAENLDVITTAQSWEEEIISAKNKKSP
jgi:hypothetical protein